jgi:hypothetical protein
MHRQDQILAFYDGYFSKEAGLWDDIKAKYKEYEPQLNETWDGIKSSYKEYEPQLKKALPYALTGLAAGGLSSLAYDAASGNSFSGRRAMILALLGAAGGGAYGAYGAKPGTPTEPRGDNGIYNEKETPVEIQPTAEEIAKKNAADQPSLSSYLKTDPMFPSGKALSDQALHQRQMDSLNRAGQNDFARQLNGLDPKALEAISRFHTENR